MGERGGGSCLVLCEATCGVKMLIVKSMTYLKFNLTAATATKRGLF